ncbi:SGNH/GDSL hydrolase family protein [Pseudoflavitalea rhizosphaerae]|uniref:SGNH/GDSL hydrolase family protein n=1 Tax=Pseudoflavitalea rhizosphaerae TaxID=1884793 RepID=UPI000F8D4565|nr:SGNH/GDSL hydrolase family protein [Pseudoflavitalea rhizosphaerae]
MIKKSVQRLFVVIIIILVVKILGVVLTKSSPNGILFYQSLTSVLTTLTLAWWVLALLLDLVFIKSKKSRPTAWISLGVLAVIVTIGELFAASWIKHPEKIPGSFRTGFKWLYAHNYGQVIQIVPECSEYDSAFYYNLIPDNTCTFSNVEFANKFSANSRGFRDDDSSLVKPEIICLGDSYMMGWGVDQDQSVPARLEQLTGKRTLNAAMSSFGTPRELMRYRTLDTSAVKYLVIQYCSNDNEENQAYLGNNHVLKISSRASYDSLRFKNEWNKKYFPGKFFVLASKYQAKETLKSLMGKPPSNIGMPIEYPKDAKMFLDILKDFPVDFQKTKVLVFEGIDVDHRNNDFKNAVEALLKEPGYKSHFGDAVRVIDVASLLQPEDFYILDGHFRAVAHEKVAKELAKVME